MKKILTLICALVLGMGVSQAQVHEAQTAVGANLVYGTEIKSPGVGARFQYGILDQLRTEVGFNYFFAHKKNSCWDVNINAHYLLNVWNQKVYIYPIVGINYTMMKYGRHTEEDGTVVPSDEDNHIGFNVGLGAEYELTDHIGVNLEYRHTIIRSVDQGVIGAGINYKF